jgi:hypothetical protein
MPIIVVGGSGRNVGKTSLVCSLIAALPEFEWTAVKVTSHAHGEREAVWEETAAGQGTDTGRYLVAGARRAFLVTATGEKLPIAAIQSLLDANTNLIFESNRVVHMLKPDLCLGVIGGTSGEVKCSFEVFVDHADALVIAADGDPAGLKLRSSGKIFRLARIDRISSETLDWVRARLSH